jgi:hypothetical protein
MPASYPMKSRVAGRELIVEDGKARVFRSLR